MANSLATSADDALASLRANPPISDSTLERRFNPSYERLWAKIASVEQTVSLVNEHHTHHELHAYLVENLDLAKKCVTGVSGHPNLAWRFLHRVDEDVLLVMPFEEFLARAIDVKLAFELNIAEPALRGEWLGPAGGEKGRLVKAIDTAESSQSADDFCRETVRAALRIVNEHADRRFWVLSQNVLTSVWSGALLALTAAVFAFLWWADLEVFRPVTLGLADSTKVYADLLPVALLGAMGQFLSNLLTKEDFLFVRGGPYFRYLLHPLAAKPILSAFAAVFVYVVARSGLVFSLVAPDHAAATSAITIQLTSAGLPYAYAILAIASGFAADKILRDTIDSVLKRLEQNAEKTVKTTPQTE